MDGRTAEDRTGPERSGAEPMSRSDREQLIERIYSAIMQLPEESRYAIHKKHLERYGWLVVQN